MILAGTVLCGSANKSALTITKPLGAPLKPGLNSVMPLLPLRSMRASNLRCRHIHRLPPRPRLPVSVWLHHRISPNESLSKPLSPGPAPVGSPSLENGPFKREVTTA